MKKWTPYTANEIQPRGWLLRQLEIQAAGLPGNLDKMWKDVRDSAWIGGKADGWERVPHWLDGFIPLAYLLENEDMIARAKKYIDAIIMRQNPDGWIAPCSEESRKDYDQWALLLFTKTLKVYYDCSGDEKIIDALYRTLKNLYELFEKGVVKLKDWGKSRYFEGFIAIDFIYGIYKEDWLVELAHILREQGMKWSENTHLWKRALNKWTQETHLVNIMLMLKEEAISCDLFGEPYTDKASNYCNLLYDYNGTAVETFTGDECLSGLSPIQGTELCSIAEEMYSYETLYAYTGDKKWAEKLEVIAFNAIPATISDDMWRHQYVQQVNQINCVNWKGKSVFRTDGPDCVMFGLEPGYGCCTVEMGQAWPKFALSAYLHDGDKVLNALTVPSKLRTSNYSVELKTNYPFENKLEYVIEAQKDFEFYVRIPSFAENLRVNGTLANVSDYYTAKIRKGEKREIEIAFDVSPRFVPRPNGLSVVKCGSLVFSLPLDVRKVMYEYTRDEVERKFPYCDYELFGESEWRYALCDEKPEPIRNKISDIPFSSENPPVTVKVKGKKIEWDYEDGYDCICAKTPATPLKILGETEELTLVPYGCAKLRMTEMPLINEKRK